jgi:hypothetical protein
MDHGSVDTLDRIKAATAVVPIGRRAWNKRLISGLLASVALAVSLWAGPVSAHEAHEVDKVSATLQRMRAISPEQAATRAPFVELGALDSRPGESKVDFLLRVGRILDAFTGRTRHEACGAIMKAPNAEAWRVRLITNRSQLACVRIIFPEQGFEPTRETIHSHPIGGKWSEGLRITTNAMDLRLRGRWPCGTRIGVLDKDFSPGDIQNGAGYLIARGKLLYLAEGEERGRILGEVDRAAPLDPLSVSSPDSKAQAREEQVFSTTTSTPPAAPALAPSVAVWSGQASGEGLPELTCPNMNNKNL